jgi:hypothetical protein
MRKLIAPLMLLSALTIAPITHSQELGFTPATNLIAAQAYYIALDGLRVRSTPEEKGKTMGVLNKNERVRIVNPEIINGKFVQVEIIKTTNDMITADKYYVIAEYLSEKIIDYKEFIGKHFIVVNVATETLRLYERQCLDNSCPSKMLMETEVVVGENRDLGKAEIGKGRSILGSYRITGWSKFYQDGASHYPAWWKEGSPELPEPGAGFNQWLRPKIMPKDENGETHGTMRGAFGWYTAFVGPSAYGQWTHGTIGWGEDKDDYVKKTKKLITNIISNPRSSGCTRNNNEAIAYLREMVEVGTPIVKIYARESLFDSRLRDYPDFTQQWDYILTKKAGQKSDRNNVLQSLKIDGYEADAYWAAKRAGAAGMVDPQSPLNQILEVGAYTIDTMPTAYAFTPGEKLGKLEASRGRDGNVYRVKAKNMSYGIYYVDAGILSGYNHPNAILETSGFEDEETPPWMDINNLK